MPQEPVGKMVVAWPELFWFGWRKIARSKEEVSESKQEILIKINHFL